MSRFVNFLEWLLSVLKPKQDDIRERGRLCRNQQEADELARLGK